MIMRDDILGRVDDDVLFEEWRGRQLSKRNYVPSRGVRDIVLDACERIIHVTNMDEYEYDTEVLRASFRMDEVLLSDIKSEDWFDSRTLMSVGGFKEGIKFWCGRGVVFIDWGGRVIPLHINMYGDSWEMVRGYFDAYAFRILRWIYVMLRNPPLAQVRKGGRGVVREPCFESLTLHWFILDIPKEILLGSRGGAVTSSMVNTGYTWRCKPRGVIVLYRIEDGFKVFIHETIHAFGYDTRMLGVGSGYREKITLANGFIVDLCEVCCEIFARIYYVVECLCVRHDCMHIRSRRNSGVLFSSILGRLVGDAMSLLGVEVWWGIYQADKLIRLSTRGVYSLRCILGDLNASSKLTREGIMYSERTPAISYYVVSGMLLHELYYEKLSEVERVRLSKLTIYDYLRMRVVSLFGLENHKAGVSFRHSRSSLVSLDEILLRTDDKEGELVGSRSMKMMRLD